MASIETRLAALQAAIDSDTTARETLEAEKAEAEAVIEETEREIDSMRDALKELEEEAARKVANAEQVKKNTAKTSSSFNKALKDIGTWVNLPMQRSRLSYLLMP